MFLQLMKSKLDSTKCNFVRIEPMAGAVQGRPGAHVGVSASGQALDGVVQRQPANTSVGRGGRLPAGRPGSRGSPLQGPGAGRRHGKVSRLASGFWPNRHRSRSTCRRKFLKVAPTPCRLLCFEAVNDAEQTASPSRPQQRRAKAKAGRTTRRGRGRGESDVPSRRRLSVNSQQRSQELQR